MDILNLKNKAKHIQASVRIGKYGITKAIIDEIKRQLKDRKLVKTKFLKNAGIVDIDKATEELANKTNSLLVYRIGTVMVLYKK